MSTRSVVGLADDNGGVYIHNDGYPEHHVPILVPLIKHMGAENLCKILKEKEEWSSLDLDTNKDSVPDSLNGRAGAVEGVGVYYTDFVPNGRLRDFRSEEYGYALHSNGDIDVIDSYGDEVTTINAFDSAWREKLEML